MDLDDIVNYLGLYSTVLGFAVQRFSGFVKVQR